MVVGATLLLGESVNAWGGLFNRFKPEALKNEGYGSHSGIGYYPFYQVSLFKYEKLLTRSNSHIAKPLLDMLQNQT